MISKILMIICLLCIVSIVFSLISRFIHIQKKRIARKKLSENMDSSKNIRFSQDYYEAIIKETMKGL